MNDFDRRIIGVTSQEDLLSLRDLMQQLVKDQSELLGRFNEHADAEEHWQDRIEDFVRDEPTRIAKEVGKQVAMCRQESARELQPALEIIEEVKHERLDRRAVQASDSDRARRIAFLIAAGMLLVVTYLLITHNLDHAAVVTAMTSALAAWSGLFLYKRR